MNLNEGNETMKRGNQISYQREFKLAAVRWFNEHGKNVSATARKFNVDQKRIREWVKNVETIKNMKKQTERNGCGQKPLYLLIETNHKNVFLEKRKKEMSVKTWLFRARARKLVDNFYPTADFKCSDHCTSLFLKCNRISLRHKTHRAQKLPEDAVPKIKSFHQYLLKVCSRGVCQVKDIANMDQTPLPFIMDANKTYEETNSKDVVAKTGASGLDKRQSTVQITMKC